MPKLKPKDIQGILADYFPRKNDDSPSTYEEEVAELADFGIDTAKELRGLLSKWAAKAKKIDASPMRPIDIKLYKECFGEELVTKRVKARYWFSFPGLLRLTLALEFGDAYEEYRRNHDTPESGASANGAPHRR